MARIVQILVALLLVFGSTGVSSAQQADITYCTPTASLETRGDLGGYYLNDGWELGFIEVLQITAIGNELFGNLMTVKYLDGGSYDRSSSSFTGAFDSSQLSLVFGDLFGTAIITGDWSESAITLKWPTDTGNFSGATFYPVSDYAAELILDRWPRHTAREANAELLIPTLVRVTAFDEWQPSAVERIYADTAANQLGFPSGNAMDLLIGGWLASGGFSDQQPGSLPNQINRYAIHTFSTPQQAGMAAACWLGLQGVDRSHLLSVPSPFNSEIYYFTSSGAEDWVMTTVLAIHGSNLITASLYGTEPVQEHGLEMVSHIIEEIGEIR